MPAGQRKPRPGSAAPHRQRTSKANCPLSDPSIGMIPENDHRVGQCLCRFCTCSQHLCVANKPRNPWLASTFSTRYQKEFPEKQFDVPLRTTPQLYVPNGQKMDLRTTNQATYTPIKPTPQHRAAQTPTQRQVKLLGHTTYANEFPHWGPQKVVYEKHWHPPVRSTALDFQGSSTYHERFTGKAKTPWDFSKENFKGFTANRANLTLCQGERLEGVTTYSRTMQETGQSHLNHRVKVEATQYRRVSASPHHFGTTTATFYKPAAPGTFRDPRVVKQALLQHD